MTIGSRLTELEIGYTLFDVSLATEFSTTTVHAHKSDKNSPNVRQLLRYAEFFDMTLPELVEGVTESL